MCNVGVALLSYGTSGQVFHAPFILAQPGLQLIGAWERSAQRIAGDYEGVKSYPSLDAVLHDDAVALVVVNTPTNTHYQYALRALRAGKHVLVEKAFTTTVAEAVQLKEVADKKDLVLAVYQNRRWDSDFSTVRQVVQSGQLGSVQRAEFSFLRFRPQLRTKLHVESPGPGAGLLYDLGPHLIDQALSLFGMPHSISAILRLLRPGTRVDDEFDLQLYYDRLKVRLYSSMMAGEAAPAYVVYGDKGTFIKSRADQQEALLKTGTRPGATDWYTEPESAYGTLYQQDQDVVICKKIASVQGSYLDFYAALYAAIIHREAVPVTASDGIRVMQIIEAAQQSNQQQRIVVL